MCVIAMGVIDEPMIEKNEKERNRNPLDDIIDFY